MYYLYYLYYVYSVYYVYYVYNTHIYYNFTVLSSYCQYVNIHLFHNTSYYFIVFTYKIHTRSQLSLYGKVFQITKNFVCMLAPLWYYLIKVVLSVILAFTFCMASSISAGLTFFPATFIISLIRLFR